MIRFSAAVAVLAILLAGGCTSDDKPDVDDATPTPKATKSTSAPRATQSPDPVDGRSHRLNVTVHVFTKDFGWVVGEDGQCVAGGSLDAPAEVLPELEVLDADGTVVARKRGPAMGEKRADGTCEADVVIEAPYRDSYTLALTVEGRGIAASEEPAENPVVVTEGTEQDVTYEYR